MKRIDALEMVKEVLGKVRAYVEEHDTFDDLAELNRKYVPAALQDDVAWLADMAERLLDADPTNPDHDDAVEVPPVPAR